MSVDGHCKVALCAVDRGFEPLSDQIKELKLAFAASPQSAQY
jgi:hypothetical protein